ncbi:MULTISPECIES: MipA/OmpV family protein [Enterobacteriaceae]|nr:MULTISPECIES: MipA/OmpV family protein [Enterobacteriaceae]ALQ47394.1 MltA-interacting protein MipA [Raoultella ornithinolytica]EKX4892939.1 MipA/OmpV family protein [Raoultella ornithinolytica]ELT0603829.1 MipA/OmpV family protein [Raoultella ornithinolytica]ELT0734984.1 MipA/OmpV family protein [Raoultella ornithinolytica]KAA2098572.1 MipA/OmpV family protein [Escherichia coli]
MKRLKILSWGLLCTAMSAKADEFSLGVAAMVVASPYVKTQARVLPVPVLGYEGEHGYFRGLAGGVYLWNDEHHTLSVNAYYLPFQYDPDDSDNDAMKRLDKRRSTLMAGMGYRYKHPVWGQLRLEISGDTLNNSNGILGDIGYLYPITLGAWRLAPAAGLTWTSGTHNDYYYGVSASESARSGLTQYQPGSSWTPYVEMSVNYRFNENWRAFFIARGTALSSEVSNSPMVSEEFSGMLMTGVSYVY